MEQSRSGNARTWAMAAHLSAFAGFIIPWLGGIVGPLIVWFLKKEEMPAVDTEGKKAINFQISILIYSAAAVLLIFIGIGIPILIGLAIFDVVMVIIASMKTYSKEEFQYPLSLKLIK